MFFWLLSGESIAVNNLYRGKCHMIIFHKRSLKSEIVGCLVVSAVH